MIVVYNPKIFYSVSLGQNVSANYLNFYLSSIKESFQMKDIQAAAINDQKLIQKKQHWHSYCDGHNNRSKMPEYLAKNYWWAYLSPIGVNIFDYPFMVNRILWGQYHKIAQDTVELLAKESDYLLAQISCAYGEIIPKVGAESHAKNVHLFDVSPIQLQQARKKITKNHTSELFNVFEADAENIPLADNSVDTSLIFFLLHELPVNVRSNVMKEALRITKPGGRIIIADYAPKTTTHWFHRLSFFRGIFEGLEPFLGNFWRSNLPEELSTAAHAFDKELVQNSEKFYWHKFYRLLDFTVKK